MNKTKPVLIFLMKLLVSAGLIVFFFTQIHIERFLGTLASAQIFLHRAGAGRLSPLTDLKRREMDDFSPPSGLRGPAQRVHCFLSHRDVFQSICAREPWAGMSAGFTIWPAMTRLIRKRRLGRLNSSRRRFRVHGSRRRNGGAGLAWRHRTCIIPRVSCARRPYAP